MRSHTTKSGVVLATIARQFLRSHLRRKSRKTKLAYESDLNQFVKFTGPKKSVMTALTAATVSKWVEELQRSGRKNSTVRRSLVTLNLFADYCLDTGKIEASPFWRLNLKAPKTKRIALPDENSLPMITSLRISAKALFKHIDAEHPYTKHRNPTKQRLLRRKRLRALRNIVILELLSTFGLRPAELSSLNIYDIRNRFTLLRITNTNKTRALPITGTYQRELFRKYFKDRRQSEALTSALLLNNHNQRLSTQGIQNALSYLARNCKIKRKITPRLLRQSLELQMFDRGLNPSIISYVLDKQFVIRQTPNSSTTSTPPKAISLELNKAT